VACVKVEGARSDGRGGAVDAACAGHGGTAEAVRTTEGTARGQDDRGQRAQRTVGELVREEGGGAQVHRKEVRGKERNPSLIPC
jgi:hypothetical protein